MTRSGKLGVASICLLGTMLVGGPVAFAGAWISAVLGALAAQNGSKSWLVIPGMTVVSTAFMLMIAFRSY